MTDEEFLEIIARVTGTKYASLDEIPDRVWMQMKAALLMALAESED